MKKSKKRRLLNVHIFAFVIAVFIFLFVMAIDPLTPIPEEIEKHMLDINFDFRTFIKPESIEKGTLRKDLPYNVSRDIIIIGMDDNTITRLGTWPFPRHGYATFLSNLGRIRQQKRRENSIFVDVFFLDQGDTARDDALLKEAYGENNRVFSEIVLNWSSTEETAEERKEMYDRMQILFNKVGSFKNIEGDTSKIPTFYGVQAPLQPLVQNSKGYGHASFSPDSDDIYRSQNLIAKAAFLINSFPFDEIDLYVNDLKENHRLGWLDINGEVQTIDLPLTPGKKEALQKLLEANAPLKKEYAEGTNDVTNEYYVIDVYEDYYIPAITLSLALNYFNKSLDDVEIILGKYLRIPQPQVYNGELNQWEPYSITITPDITDKETGDVIIQGVTEVLQEIKIPIDDFGRMVINYMGKRTSESQDGYQTFLYRSMSAYLRSTGLDPSRWPRSYSLDNKIIMLGAFSKGVASDEKYTPYGAMYGVEMHANALNTIIMNNFLTPVSEWVNILILGVVLLVVSLYTSRLQTIWGLFITFFLLFSLFIANAVLFEAYNVLINFSRPAISIFFCYLLIVIYRAMTEEKDKKRIQGMFGKYVSPAVVTQLVNSRPPELGGIDRSLTVLFSDIRGFTTLSESMSPQELVNHLNQYLSKMTDTIMDYRGTLDKYVGDEIMCFWGAPIPQKDHAVLAAKCALKMMEELKILNDSWPDDRKIDIGIGLNSGIMTVGNMGSQGRMNYTLMGDNVNLGARLEGTNKQYLTNVIISEYTYSLIKETAIVRELDNIRVKGKNKPVLIYELLDFTDGIEILEPSIHKKR